MERNEKEESQYGAQIPNTPENVAETLGWLLNNLIAKSVTPEAKLNAKYPELKGKSFTNLK